MNYNAQINDRNNSNISANDSLLLIPVLLKCYHCTDRVFLKNILRQ